MATLPLDIVLAMGGEWLRPRGSSPTGQATVPDADASAALSRALEGGALERLSAAAGAGLAIGCRGGTGTRRERSSYQDAKVRG